MKLRSLGDAGLTVFGYAFVSLLYAAFAMAFLAGAMLFLSGLGVVSPRPPNESLLAVCGTAILVTVWYAIASMRSHERIQEHREAFEEGRAAARAEASGS